MSSTLSVLKLHLNRRVLTFVVPLNIVGIVAAISVLVSLLFLRSGSVPGTSIWIDSSRSNPGILYSLAGFLIYLGVQAVATTFPFALSLGATRKAFVTGTLAWAAVTSAYLTAVLAVLAFLEVATHHWFAGFYVFDVYVLGAGDLTRLIPIVFLGTLACLTLGGVFGASFVRLGARGPQFLAAGLAFVILIALLIVLPDLSQIMAGFKLWWLAVLGAGVIALSALGAWSLLRSASVR